MNSKNQSIYQQVFMPSSNVIDELMSERGEAFLDSEIMKIKEEIGDEQFKEYALDFFKNTGIDYLKFFKLEQASPNTTVHLKTEQQPSIEQQQIKQKVEERRGETSQQQIIEVNAIDGDPQEYTNNSEYMQNEYEQIERLDLGNNKFKISYKNGDIYEGQMQSGMKNGWGDYHYQSGQKYSGFFVDDQINGYGHYYFISGAHYEGDWSSSMKHGIGILNLANKDCYEGYFSNDDLHGKGTYRYSNGDVFQGTFKIGKREGAGKFYGADGRVQIGQWVNDQFQV